MRFEIAGGPGNSTVIVLDATHLAHEINSLVTQSPFPATVSDSYLKITSWVFTLGQCSEVLKITGRVHNNTERKILEDTLRSWYYWANPSMGTNLPIFYEDDGTMYEGLPGEILWSQDGARGRELDYTFDFAVINSPT